jgi:hypothetical protein
MELMLLMNLSSHGRRREFISFEIVRTLSASRLPVCQVSNREEVPRSRHGVMRRKSLDVQTEVQDWSQGEAKSWASTSQELSLSRARDLGIVPADTV